MLKMYSSLNKLFFIKILTFLRILFNFENTIHEHNTNDLLSLLNHQTNSYKNMLPSLLTMTHILEITFNSFFK